MNDFIKIFLTVIIGTIVSLYVADKHAKIKIIQEEKHQYFRELLKLIKKINTLHWHFTTTLFHPEIGFKAFNELKEDLKKLNISLSYREDFFENNDGEILKNYENILSMLSLIMYKDSSLNDFYWSYLRLHNNNYIDEFGQEIINFEENNIRKIFFNAKDCLKKYLENPFKMETDFLRKFWDA